MGAIIRAIFVTLVSCTMCVFRAWKELGRAWLVGIFLLATLGTAMAQPRRVLLLHSFGPHFAPWSAIAGRFREDLIRQSPNPIDLYEASLQNGRFERSQDEGPFLDYLRSLFVENDLDLAVAMGAPAARFFQRYRSQIFPSTPLLITGADERTFNDAALTTYDTAVAVNFDQAKQIENILQVLPDTANIAVVIGDSPLENFWVEELRRAFQPFGNRVTFDWFNKLSLDDMVKRVVKLPPRSAIYYATVRVDARGVPQEEDHVLSQFREVASAPIFSYIDSNFGRGIVGGPLLSSQQLAHRSAVVAVRILGGETAGNIKTPALGLSVPMYDWRELQRWNISEAILPPSSEIHFRGPTAWERYRVQVLVICAALLLQAALICWLLYEQRRRHRAEVLSRNFMSELTHMNRIATAGELSASIAHEVNQPLAGMVLTANAALRWLAAETPNLGKVRDALAQIVSAGHRAGDIIRNVRTMFGKDTQERRPVDINRVILAVLKLVQIEIQRHEIAVQTQLDHRLPPVIGLEIQLQQVILNLIMNAIESMQSGQSWPRELRVKSELGQSDEVRVCIEDSGTGTAPSDLERVFTPLFTTKERGMGMGLSICHSIIAGHNGRIWATAGVERGAIFHFVLPTK